MKNMNTKLYNNKTVKCKNCEWKKIRDYNPAFIPDDVIKICQTQVFIMNDVEANKNRVCICFRKVD